MAEENDSGFRALREREHRILKRLLDHHPFEGRNELLKQLDSTSARLISDYQDNYGSIEPRVTDSIPANVRYRVPVEAEYLDDDGVPVWVLLHVRDGVMCELEICRADGGSLISAPIPEQLEPFSADYDALIADAKAKAGARK